MGGRLCLEWPRPNPGFVTGTTETIQTWGRLTKEWGAALLVDTFEDALSGQVRALRRYAMALVGDPTQADDLVQESLARAIARSSSWHSIRNMRAYLFTILHNLRADQLKKKYREGDQVSIDDVANQLSQPPTQLARLENRELVVALGKLPEQQREVLLLVGLEGLSYKEAADVLAVPIGTVMSRISRGREALRHLMAGETSKRLRRVK